MRQGTTPRHTFELPFGVDVIDKVRVIYSQNGINKLIKEKGDCILEGNTVQVNLTQEDTFLFDCRYPVKLQVRVLTIGGDALATEPYSMTVYECLEMEVIK